MNWTPGEWRCDTVGAHRFIHSESGKTIAHLAPDAGIKPRQRTANGNLIAAAPDLYAALDAIIDAVFDDGTRVNRDHFAAARAALQKARGEQS